MTKAPFRRIEPRILRREEAAEYIGMHATTFDAEVKAGNVPRPLRMTERRLKGWDRLDLDRWIEERKELAANDAEAPDSWADV
jgi:prophage regulatory protein